MVEVSIVIPTYNERKNIKRLLQKVSSALKGRFDYEIIVVDDNSPDGTAAEVKKAARSTHARLVSRKTKAGIGSAYKKGAESSRGRIVITMDADFSHDPSVLPQMVEGILDGNDLVIGSRYVRGGKIERWNPYRRLVSKTANTIAKVLLGLHTNDLTTGYRAYTREALGRIRFQELSSTGYSILMEAVFRAERASLRIKEIPIVFYDRKGGNSKLGVAEQFRYALTVLHLRLGGYT
ncbi:MAG: polyprenol monophosphomannose synthase [Candidatus Fermentimicrarchaeum limneticum]|uniref:Polyprenol monophosphomannose synthase n=1 Tax=Fermentimicrarchaeum limneticum TaxID=2795018 RepID=A0A7D6BMM4_FERL1|nr:MAG: polyprenol monophosphomannose synthase [Candidatus Fermentimicrarchaeum limneticum]